MKALDEYILMVLFVLSLKIVHVFANCMLKLEQRNRVVIGLLYGYHYITKNMLPATRIIRAVNSQDLYCIPRDERAPTSP